MDKKANLDELRLEIATLVQQLYPKFPREVSYPSIGLNNPNELATVSRQEQPATEYYRINGQNTINVVVNANAGANQPRVVAQLKTLLTAIRPTLPPAYEVRIEYDATPPISAKILTKLRCSRGWPY